MKTLRSPQNCRVVILAAAWSLLLSGSGWARDIYVSPSGTPAGKGTKDSPLDLASAVSAVSPALPGDVIYLLEGTYEGKMEGIKRLPFQLGVSGTATNPATVMPEPGKSAHLNGSVEIRSSHARFIGLDIGDLKWDPWQKQHQAATTVNALAGVGAKIINCNIFGGAMGTGCWQPAINLELYGCLIHDFGTLEAAGRGHGHAFYAQNRIGRKVFMHNIAYRGCGWNVHVYTQESNIDNFNIIENICYIAGAYKEAPKQTMDNYLIAGYPAADGLRVVGNVGYQPSDVQQWRPNMRLSNYRAVMNGTAVVKDNYLMGAFQGLSLGPWQHIEVTGNTVWATGVFVEISSSPTGGGLGDRKERPKLDGYNVSGNTYINNGREKPFTWNAREQHADEDFSTFEEWQQLGLDKDSKVVPGKNGKPTGSKVFVFPNRYEKGRANVAVFDWDGKKEAAADLSPVLAKGQGFRVYNCLDVSQTLSQAKPVMTSTFEGTPVSLPLRRDPVSPDFDAFLVVPAGKDVRP
jgi:hypothetical protein